MLQNKPNCISVVHILLGVYSYFQFLQLRRQEKLKYCILLKNKTMFKYL